MMITLLLILLLVVVVAGVFGALHLVATDGYRRQPTHPRTPRLP